MTFTSILCSSHHATKHALLILVKDLFLRKSIRILFMEKDIMRTSVSRIVIFLSYSFLGLVRLSIYVLKQKLSINDYVYCTITNHVSCSFDNIKELKELHSSLLKLCYPVKLYKYRYFHRPKHATVEFLILALVNYLIVFCNFSAILANTRRLRTKITIPKSPEFTDVRRIVNTVKSRDGFHISFYSEKVPFEVQIWIQ